MSVSVRTVVIPRLWRGYEDPGLPSGGYIANLIAVGNATGGQVTLNFDFKPQLESASGRYYNIEQINMFKTSTTTAQVAMQINQFEEVGRIAISTRRERFGLFTDDNGHAAIDYGTSDAPPMPYFLGKSTRTVSLFAVVIFGIANVDLVVYSVTISGFIWEPRSTMMPGGLRRPIDSLYGR